MRMPKAHRLVPGCPVRACIGIQIFFACFMVYVLRVTISINLLAMVTTAKTSKNVTVSECVAEQQSQSATATPPPDVSRPTSSSN